jgi:hypothetical protein
MHNADQFKSVPNYVNYVKHETNPIPSQTYQNPLYPTLHPYTLIKAHQKLQDNSEMENLNKYTTNVQHDHEAFKHGHEEDNEKEEKEVNYSKEGGSSKKLDHHAAKGEKSSKGYKSDHTYEKGKDYLISFSPFFAFLLMLTSGIIIFFCYFHREFREIRCRRTFRKV